MTLLSKADFQAMASAANTAIENVLSAGSLGMLSPPRDEVGFVAAMTLGGVQEIARVWTPICSGLGLRIELSGVFCHASPMVKFDTLKRRGNRCELADMLIVVDIGDSASFVRKASLIQAKMARAAARVSLSGASSQVQLHLYQNWPEFAFEEAVYGLKDVDFTIGGSSQVTGTFGVIDRHFKTPVWTQHDATPTPAAVFSQPLLGTFITGMIDGAHPGFGRLATPTLKTDWSKTVERLLTVTYARAFHHKPTLGPTGAPRGISAVACLSLASIANQTVGQKRSIGGPPYSFDIRHDDREPSGISIVHIVITPTTQA